MGLFSSKSKFKLNHAERLEFDRLFLNVHKSVKIEFELLSRTRQEANYKQINGELLIYHFLLKKKFMAFIHCYKYFIEKNEDRTSIWAFDLYLKKYPTVIYEINGSHQKKKNGNYIPTGTFYFEFEPLINQFKEETQLFSKKLRRTVEKKSIKLIKSTFK